MHEMGSKLEVKSNCPEFETFIITTTGNKRSVVLNGKELTVVDFQRGARRISQTTELPSGEHLTTTVEWTEDSLKKNQATITVEVTPNRKFKGIFGWDFQTLSTGNFHFDVKGENPWVGNYAVDRHANWEMNKPGTCSTGSASLSSRPVPSLHSLPLTPRLTSCSTLARWCSTPTWWRLWAESSGV